MHVSRTVKLQCNEKLHIDFSHHRFDTVIITNTSLRNISCESPTPRLAVHKYTCISIRVHGLNFSISTLLYYTICIEVLVTFTSYRIITRALFPFSRKYFHFFSEAARSHYFHIYVLTNCICSFVHAHL